MTETSDLRPAPNPHAAVQRACEDHLAACYAALYAEEEAEPGVDLDYPAAAGPFCGCETCVVREVLHAARPYLAALARAEGQC